MLEISILGSGSSGNCALVRTERTTLLLDAGLSARQINRRLELQGVDPESLEGILITHEHGDHTRGIDVFCRSRPMPIYCTMMTKEVIQDAIKSRVEWRLFEAGQEFSVGDFKVHSFPVPHDAVDPLGYLLVGGGTSLGVVSDVGHVTALVKTQLRAADTIFVEANYDEVMLQNDTRRPWPTKQRILSRHGHLSNDQAAELIAEAATERLQQVILGHLSQDCNDPALARDTVLKRLREAGFPGVEVRCAHQERPTDWVAAGVRPAESVLPEPEELGEARQGSLF